MTFGTITNLTTHSLSPELLKSTVSINLEGAFFAVQAAARQMKAQSPQGGSIIGVSSISALVGGAGQTHYTPTKAGILSLMQSCACALGPYNIRCNALLPGTIRTQLNDEDLADPNKKEYMEGRIPLRRLGQPHVCASKSTRKSFPNGFLGSCWTRSIPRFEPLSICCKCFRQLKNLTYIY
jgi:NAD(P)-dependent dehydrogenase (short-subunit alcohol dehydrogenase family)